MIYGAEGAIGLVNLILLLSALVALGLVVSLIAYMRSVGIRSRVRAHPIRSALTTIILVLISLPALVTAPILLRSYIDNRSFESQINMCETCTQRWIKTMWRRFLQY